MSPEILKETYDHRCDLWSAGVVLYILVSGVAPFDGESEEEVYKRIRSLDYSLAGKCVVMLVPELDDVSLLLKDLIKKLLKPESERISIDKIF